VSRGFWQGLSGKGWFVQVKAHERLLELAHPSNSALLLRIVGIDLFTTVMLKFYQPKDILPYLTPKKTGATRNAADCKRVETIVRYIDFLIWRNIPILKGACLKRSIVLYYFLRKEGLKVVINIGVAKEEGDLIGHSWLTLDDTPCYETREHAERFNVVLRYPEH
jgi:hypothetical protein